MVGDQIAWEYSGSQTSFITQAFIADATDLYFAWAAVGLVPNNGVDHSMSETPWFQVRIFDNTTNTVLKQDQFFTGNLGSIVPGWLPGAVQPNASGVDEAGIWYYRPWETYHLTGVTLGDSLTVTLTARDCTLGGHASYAYLDGFGVEPPPIPTVPEPTSLLLLGTGLAGLRAWRKRRG